MTRRFYSFSAVFFLIEAENKLRAKQKMFDREFGVFHGQVTHGEPEAETQWQINLKHRLAGNK